MDTREALCTIGDRIETDSLLYRNMLECGSTIHIQEKTDDGVVEVTIRKERE